MSGLPRTRADLARFLRRKLIRGARLEDGVVELTLASHPLGPTRFDLTLTHNSKNEVVFQLAERVKPTTGTSRRRRGETRA